MSTVLNFNSLDELVAQQTSIVARYKLYNGEVELLYDDAAHTQQPLHSEAAVCMLQDA